MENENKLPPDFKAKWVAALRSGEYKQGFGALYDPKINVYCCIGVYAKANQLPLTESGLDFLDTCQSHSYYENIQKYIGINHVRELVHMNDQDKKSFSEIADYIEENL